MGTLLRAGLSGMVAGAFVLVPTVPALAANGIDIVFDPPSVVGPSGGAVLATATLTVDADSPRAPFKGLLAREADGLPAATVEVGRDTSGVFRCYGAEPVAGVANGFYCEPTMSGPVPPGVYSVPLAFLVPAGTSPGLWTLEADYEPEGSDAAGFGAVQFANLRIETQTSPSPVSQPPADVTQSPPTTSQPAAPPPPAATSTPTPSASVTTPTPSGTPTPSTTPTPSDTPTPSTTPTVPAAPVPTGVAAPVPPPDDPGPEDRSVPADDAPDADAELPTAVPAGEGPGGPSGGGVPVGGLALAGAATAALLAWRLPKGRHEA